LEKKRKSYRRVLIVTDSVFSMDGDMADIRTLLSVAEEFDCILYVDDAHGTGTIGEGRGVLREFGLKWTDRIVLMGTLSKALGSYGAFVCGSQDLVDLLVNRARSLIFTTSLPPPVCAGALKAVEILEKNPELVERLKERSLYIHRRLSELSLEVPFHGTPIIPIMVGEEEKALRISEGLLRSGILLRAIRYPTVPKGKARLRLTVSLRYREEDIDLLLDRLGELI